MIERILDKDMSVKTIDLEMMNADEDFRTAFETSDRLIREESFKLSHHEEELPSEETDNVGPSEKSQGDIIDSSEHEEEKQEREAVQTNTNGWSGLLGTLGLEGLGDITGNLGYVMAMLPDILLGAFTGKTQSLRFGDNLLPIASIVAGLFVRNPLLKMLLVGLGGANLLNKAGHEALGRPMPSADVHTENQYRRYPDEPLNSRIVNPVLQGSTLIATIDRVPCTIQLTPTVAEAYRAGALPLNTLANAVLAKSDQLRHIASQNYDDGQRETIVRTRGIQ